MTVRTTAQAAARLHPISILKEHIISLDAAMLVAVTAAEVGAVHKLRTGTRRVEALLRLIELVGSGSGAVKWPEHKKEAAAVHRRLRKVRQAAGAVRDLDVQTEAIWYDAPAKAAVHPGTPGEAMRKQAKQLRKHLESRRQHESEMLIRVLKAEEQKLAASMQVLEEALKVSQRTVAHAALRRRIQQWFAAEAQSLLRVKADSPELRLAVERLKPEQLHTLRKTAKQCRYMAESAPEGAHMRKVAEQFETIQEAGGKWHDWLLLAQISRRFHGPKAELTHRYSRHRDAALADYRLRLGELLPVLMKTQV